MQNHDAELRKYRNKRMLKIRHHVQDVALGDELVLHVNYFRGCTAKH